METAWMIQSALGKIADDLLAREQLHIRVNAETGAVTVKRPLFEVVWPDFASYLADDPMIPPYGRVWVHVE